jgi:hypothetical protein
MTQTIDQTLAERGARYGDFEGHAQITQSIKVAMYDSDSWDTLDDDIKECLEMIAHKIGRVLNGDPMYPDNFTDICGYSRLVEKRLLAREQMIKNEADNEQSAQQAANVEEISAALGVLLRAGVIRQTDDDGDA